MYNNLKYKHINSTHVINTLVKPPTHSKVQPFFFCVKGQRPGKYITPKNVKVQRIWVSPISQPVT